MPTPRGRRYDGRPMRRARARIKATQDTCWLCGRGINPELRSPHPMSFSVDHLVPVSMGGAELELANMRAAHRECNQRRGVGRRQPRPRQSRQW